MSTRPRGPRPRRDANLVVAIDSSQSVPCRDAVVRDKLQALLQDSVDLPRNVFTPQC